MELWNTKFLKPPPVNSCTCNLQAAEIHALKVTLRDGLRFFKNQTHLSTEATLLSRLIYRMKTKLRTSKELKAAGKLEKTLRIYLGINMPRHLQTLLNLIPEVYKPGQTLVVTKNMLDFVLVRIQGLGKTLHRILEISKVAFDWTQRKLRIGHFWKVTIVAYALIARIFILTKHILQYTYKLYEDLIPFSEGLGIVGVAWLPETYQLPDDLSEWLDVEGLRLEATSEVIDMANEESTFLRFLASDDVDEDVEFCDEYILINDDSSELDYVMANDEVINLSDESPTPGARKADEVVDLDDDVDIGEVVADTGPKRKKKQKKKPKQPEAPVLDKKLRRKLAKKAKKAKANELKRKLAPLM